MKTSDKIISYINEHNQTSGKELADYLNEITPRAVRKQLKKMLESGQLRKVGKPPKVYYLINQTSFNTISVGLPYSIIDPEIKSQIDKRYLYITPSGEKKVGWEGFVVWCQKTNQDLVKTAKEYVQTLQKYDALSKNGFINGIDKLRRTFAKVHLDKLFYLDFYSIERFGKTKLGQMLLYAKQSQDRILIRTLTDEITPKIQILLEKYAVDGVVFIPPTVKREVQFMHELEKQFRIPVTRVVVTKIKTDVPVPQKTLNKLEDRIENAKNTFVVEDKKQYQNILLIDDAVGSGATLNEVAAQIRSKKLCQGKIIGLAITGSYKGFDVISEV